MAENYIDCPKCGERIPLTQALTQALTGQVGEQLKKEYQAKLQAELARAGEDARLKAENALSSQLREMQEDLASKNKALDEANRNELELRRQKRELDERQKQFELEMARKMDGERQQILEAAQKQAVEEFRQKDLEKDKVINDLKKQTDEMKRKLEQGSMQTQGEVMELQLEEALKAKFPFDLIEPVGKGARGADVLQRVRDSLGRDCGTIIWESKQTKAWGGDWIEKLKEDQRQAKAEIAVIRSQTLPKDISLFGLVDNVWVANFDTALGLAGALRVTLMEVSQAKASQVGKQEKMEVLYSYIFGPQFKQRVTSIVESFNAMKDDLDREKASMGKIWAKREKQIEQVVISTVGMYGDMEGIIGSAMPQIDSLELKQIGEKE